MQPTRIKWAPLRLNERGLQTLAVALIVHLAGLTSGAWLFLLLNPFQGPLFQTARQAALAYFVWQLLDWKTPTHGGRAAMWWRRSRLFSLAAAYLPAHLHVEQPLDPEHLHILALHPHGVLSMSAVVTLASEACGATQRLFPAAFLPTERHGPRGGRGGGGGAVAECTAETGAEPPTHPREWTEHALFPRFLTITFNFSVPVWRELVLLAGFVSASSASAHFLLAAGRNIAIVPGGAQESLLTGPGCADLTLAKRKGFVRLALQHGACLVPVYLFGENELYASAPPSPPSSLWGRCAHATKRLLGFTLPAVRGRGILQYTHGLLPRRVPVHTVVGTPIPVHRVEDPSQAQVDALHAQYVVALTALHERYAAGFFEEAKAALQAQGEDVSKLHLQALRVVE